MSSITAFAATLSNPINALLAALAVLTGTYVVGWSKSEGGPTLLEVAIGAVTNFFDSLGIGSFATTTALFRAFKLVPDRDHPRHVERRPYAAHSRPGVLLHRR